VRNDRAGSRGFGVAARFGSAGVAIAGNGADENRSAFDVAGVDGATEAVSVRGASTLRES
jgi:hypothetical protein